MENEDVDFPDKMKKNSSGEVNGELKVSWKIYEDSPNEETEGELEEEEVMNAEVTEGVEEIQKNYQNLEEINKTTLIIQKLVLRWLALEKLKIIKQRRFKRMQGVKELWKTEEDYVNSLVVLRDVYSRPFRELSFARKRPIITPKDYRQIFQGLEAITGFSVGFSQQMRSSIFDENGEYMHLNFVSGILHSMSPFFKMYHEYCSRYHKTIRILKDMRRVNKRFAAILDRMDRDDRTTKLGLPSYLIKPIGRVPRYKLFLREIIKYTEEEHPDYPGLQKAMLQFSESSQVINQKMNEIENSEKVLSIQKRFINTNFVIHEPRRRFVSEGRFFHGIISTTDEGENDDELHVHLFNDILIVSKVKILQGRDSNFSLEEYYRLKSIKIFYSDDDDDEIMKNKHVFKINNDTYHVNTIEERNRWLKLIHETAEEWRKMNNVEEKIIIPSPPPPRPEPTGGEWFKLSFEECVMITKNFNSPTMMLKQEKNQKLIKDHCRKFLVSPEEDRILWTEGNNENQTLEEIKISEVKEVVRGQTTIPFLKNPKPSAVGLSMSLIYGEGKFDEEKNNIWTGKSLDLICLNIRDLKIWYKALKFLIQDRGKTLGKRLKVDQKPPIQYKEILRTQYVQTQRMGDLYTFGGGLHGGLGHGIDNDLKNPKVVRRSLVLDIEKIVCGQYGCISILSNGRCLSWGRNESGRLGHGDFVQKMQPEMITSFGDTDTVIIDACIGADFSLFLDSNGVLWGCGSNVSGILGPEIEGRISLPKIIFKGEEKYTSVSCSPNAAAVVDSKGRVFTWGNGEFGNLGHGDKKNYNEPKFVESLCEVSQVSFGNWNTMFLTNGDVFCCGDGAFGQLGVENNNKNKRIESLVPLHIPTLKDIVQISAGQFHCGAVSKNGRVFMWGGGNYGQLGNKRSEKFNYEPIEIKDFQMHFNPGDDGKNKKNKVISMEEFNFLQLSCGDNHCIGLVEEKGDERWKKKKKRHVLVWAWGSGMHGRLGLCREKSRDVYRPTCNSFFDSKKMIRSVSAGGKTSAVIVAHEWIPDDEVQVCMNCTNKFSKFRRRRHHCNYCNGVFCGKCSKKKIMIVQLMGFHRPSRVCDECYLIIKRMQESHEGV